MFCPNCGSKIDDNAQFCYRCGSKIKKDGAGTERPIESKSPNTSAPPPAPRDTNNGAMAAPATDNLYKTPEPQSSDDKNIIALIGFILSFFASVPGIVCSAIGLKNAAVNGGVKHGFAKAGLIIGIVGAAVSVIVAIAVIVTVNTLIFQYYGLYQNPEGLESVIRLIAM